MDERLRLYKVQFCLFNKDCEILVKTSVIMLFARNENEAWSKFYAISKKRWGNDITNVRVKELNEKEMEQIELFLPFYKEYKHDL